MAPLPSNSSLRRRLKEIERERVALHRRIDTLSKLPEGFSAPAPARPRLRPAAIPDEWRITRPDAVRRAEHVAAAVAPGASPEFAPAPRGVRFQRSGDPDPRPGSLRPGSPAAIGEDAPADRLGTYLGAQPAFARRGKHLRSRANEGSYRARAVFAVLMVLLLGFLAIRLFT